MSTPDCPVAARFYLPYLVFHEDAEKRNRKGQEQSLCTHCQKWVWPDRARACKSFTREAAK